MKPLTYVGRVRAAQATLDAFKDKPFEWGVADCARLAAHSARQFGWKPRLNRFGAYKTEMAAAKAMLRVGLKSLAEAMDEMGPARIPPAMALPADIVQLEGDTALGSLFVALGNGRVLGWHEDAPGCTVLQPFEYVTAWRL